MARRAMLAFGLVTVLLCLTAPAFAHDCAAVDEAKAALESRLADVQSKFASLQAEASAKDRSLQDARNKIKELTEALRAPKDLGVFELLSAGIKTVKTLAVSTVDEVKAAVMAATKGDTSKGVELVQKSLVCTVTTTQATVSFVSQELDNHAPMVKKLAADGMGKICDLYKAHCASVPAVKNLEKQLSGMHEQIQAIVAKHVRSNPAMKSLDTPGGIQTATYIALGLPVALMSLVVLNSLVGLVSPKKAPRRR